MRLAWIAVTVLLLAGCASQMRNEQSAPLPVFTGHSRLLESFSITGRFSAKRGDTQGSGQFRYTQKNAIRTLDIFSPTATQLARIEANATYAKAALSDGSTREAATLAELLRQFIDIPISDAEFSSWLQGVPHESKATSVAAFTGDGKLESFRESGWTIVISSRFEGDANFVRRMRWSFDAGGDPARDAQLIWVFDAFSTP